MTLTLIGSIISYFLPFANRVFGLWENKQQQVINRENDELDHKREIELGKLQLETTKATGAARVDEVGIHAAASTRVEAQKSYREESKAPMGEWVHNIRGLVRPVITAYIAFILGWKELHGEAVSEAFAGIAVAVIIFWFGGRDMLHYGGKIGGKAGSGWQRLRAALRK